MPDAVSTPRHLQALLDDVPQILWQADADGGWTWTSAHWTRQTGLSPEASLGRGWLRALHPDDRPATMSVWDRPAADAIEHDARLVTAGTKSYRWFRLRAAPRRDADGSVIAWQGTATDIHDLRRMEERQRALVAELQHRTGNLIAVVQSLATRTARASDTLGDFEIRFSDRLGALARAHRLLSRLEDGDRVTFDDLIATELAATAGPATDRVTLDGPPAVRLRSATVQPLAMALHELATNAVTHGALGQPEGRLAVNWELRSGTDDARPRLAIGWRERGSRTPAPAPGLHRKGQGREFLERALPYQLGAETRLAVHPDGLHWTIILPLAARGDR